jgi:hypothetical protein
MNRNKLLIIAFLLFFVIIGIVFFLTETSKIKTVHPNLIAWYKFDEGKGTKVRDYSGYRNDGAIYGGASWVKDTPFGTGYALYFNGIDAMVQIPDNPILNNLEEITVTVWIKAEDLQYGASIVDKGWYNPRIWYDPPFNRFMFQLRDTQEERGFGWSDDSFSKCYKEWCFLVATYSSRENKVRLYINGELDKEFEWNGKPLVSRAGEPLKIGFQDKYFKGIISDLRIYNKALSNQEILNVMRGQII